MPSKNGASLEAAADGLAQPEFLARGSQSQAAESALSVSLTATRPRQSATAVLPRTPAASIHVPFSAQQPERHPDR